MTMRKQYCYYCTYISELVEELTLYMHITPPPACTETHHIVELVQMNAYCNHWTCNCISMPLLQYTRTRPSASVFYWKYQMDRIIYCRPRANGTQSQHICVKLRANMYINKLHSFQEQYQLQVSMNLMIQ